MMNEPVPEGPNKGLVTDQDTLDRLLDEYYEKHGWDPHTGIPKRETLRSLGLLEICGDIAVD
jgi:aldehyde:ferredoxin oxidoreductase